MTSLLPENPIVRWLVAVVLLAGIYFFHGFLIPVLAALIVAFATWPLYERLVVFCRGRTAFSASVALCVILLVLVIPLAFVISYAIQEIGQLAAWAATAHKTGLDTPASLSGLPFIGEWLAESWRQNLGEPRALRDLVETLSGEHISNISRWVLATGVGAASVLLNVVFGMITLFFIYKDGTGMVAQLDRVGERILPLRWHRFSRVVPATVSATVTGMTIIAVGEGIVLGFAYHLAGVPSAFLLGVLTGCMAMIPGGAPISCTLVSLYLVISGSPLAGVLLFAWGAAELFVVDKTLRPKLVGGPIRLPFLPTFFGLIGGVKTMGLVGIFVGPVLMALLVAIWREWLRTLDSDSSEPSAKKSSVIASPSEKDPRPLLRVPAA